MQNFNKTLAQSSNLINIKNHYFMKNISIYKNNKKNQNIIIII